MNHTNTLHTGGAKGGDLYWEDIAKKYKHSIKEYYFDGHKHTRIHHLDNKIEDNKIEDNKIEYNKIEDNKTEDNKIEDNKIEDNKIEDNKTEYNKIENNKSSEEMVELNENDKQQCDKDIMIVSKHIKKDIPEGYLKHILERDWTMINESGAKALYAIGYFDNNSFSRLHIKGNTGWIIEMFVDYILKQKGYCDKLPYSIKTLPVYFISMIDNTYYQLYIEGNDILRWYGIEKFPKPMGDWIGVGSRS